MLLAWQAVLTSESNTLNMPLGRAWALLINLAGIRAVLVWLK